jgi:hypothetical protein
VSKRFKAYVQGELGRNLMRLINTAVTFAFVATVASFWYYLDQHEKTQGRWKTRRIRIQVG